mmetsp:Transcript_25467/g.73649  ORF Transcript_25467/g.73649 Transcript_25467/m.73649 type:complete len:544 (+) Transcript_25467:102-1733(+)
MSSSEEDDDSSYESVAEERIGGMLHEAVLEVNEEIAVARPASPRPPSDDGEQTTTTGGRVPTSDEFRRSSLRALFPPFFFPTGPGGVAGVGGAGGGSGGGLGCPVQSFHLNRRRTWGSAIAHRLVMESVVPATLFRAVVAVFHLWLEESGGADDACDDKVASAPMEKIVSYVKFLAKECGVEAGGAMADKSQHRSRHRHADGDDARAAATDLTALWHHSFPSLVEASKQTIAGKTLIRSMEDTADPMALEIDLEACRSITLGEWKTFLGIPREVPAADQLADGSSDFIALLEWWNSLSQLLDGKSAMEISDHKPLYNFFVEYCRAINASVMKYTCRGLSSSIGCVHRRRCGAILNTLGHPASTRTAFYNGTTGRLVVCDLIRTYGKMNLSVGFVRSSCHAQSAIVETESIDQGDLFSCCSATTEECKEANIAADDTAPIGNDEKNKVEPLHHEELVDLYPSDDEDDNVSCQPQRTFRRIKRGLALTSPRRSGTGTIRTSISNAEKRLRCESEDDANYCEVSRAWADARDAFGLHSDEDDHDGL